MHADVIVIGHDCEAYLLGALFAHRGFRTLLLDPQQSEGERRMQLLDRELAAKLRPMGPPEDALEHQFVHVELWSASEKGVVRLDQVPLLVVNSTAYREHLEAEGLATRNLRVLRGHQAVRLVRTRDAATGVGLETGDQINARLVVECTFQPGTLQRQITGHVRQPLLLNRVVSLHAECRSAGATVSAWSIGVLALHWIPGKQLTWRYRYGTDAVQQGATLPAQSASRPDKLVERLYIESGLASGRMLGRTSETLYMGPPMPICGSMGFLMVGQAAGYGNPVLPQDLTARLAGVMLAFQASSHALAEGDVGSESLWEYSRGMATQWGRNQAFAWALMEALGTAGSGIFDDLFSAGLMTPYAASCLVRNRVIEEEALDSIFRSLSAIRRPGALMAWRKALARARRLASLYSNAPTDYTREGVMDWHARIIESW